MITSTTVRTAAAAIVVVLAAPAVWANPAAIVPTGGSGDFSLEYEYELDAARITRERAGDPAADPLGRSPKFDDLQFSGFRHLLTPRLDVGFGPDAWISAAIPIVITQARELRLASGVDRAQSPTLQDGFLPQTGFDAQNPTSPPSGDLVFRGVDRKGIPEVRLGLGVAPMNQRRDDTKPTWKIGADLRLAVGRVMRFDRNKPDGETGVSDGVHKLTLWTSIDRKIGFYEPWMKIDWTVPVSVRSTSLYQDPGFGVTNRLPSQVAGTEFGVELFAVDDKVEQNALSIEISGRARAHFEGRGYSEMWEVFAYAGDRTTPGAPLVLDADPTTDGVQAMSHPGITNIENYLEIGGRIALRAQLGPRVHVAASVDVFKLTDHVITFADSGVDLPTCGAPGAGTNCEVDANVVVNPGTKEVNPLHAPSIDRVGNRYLSEQNLGVVLGVTGIIVF